MTSRSRSRSSSKSSAPGAPELPNVFVDRSLGAYEVPEGLRAAGFMVETMPQLYGEEESQRLADVDWIPEVAALDLVIFSKDNGLTSDPERQAVAASEARVFLLPDTQAPARLMIQRYVENRFRIAKRAGKPGPYICMVRSSRLECEEIA